MADGSLVQVGVAVECKLPCEITSLNKLEDINFYGKGKKKMKTIEPDKQNDLFIQEGETRKHVIVQTHM